MRNEIVNGQPVDLINAAQVGVGTIGLFSSALNYAGIGVGVTGPISTGAGFFGMILSIPSNWFNVYKGAYDMETVLLSTPYYPSDAEIFGNQ